VTSVLQLPAGKMIFCKWPEGLASGEAEPRREARPQDRRDPRIEAIDRGHNERMPGRNSALYLARGPALVQSSLAWARTVSGNPKTCPKVPDRRRGFHQKKAAAKMRPPRINASSPDQNDSFAPNCKRQRDV